MCRGWIIAVVLLSSVGCIDNEVRTSDEPQGMSASGTTSEAPARGALGISFNETPRDVAGAVVASVVAGSSADKVGVMAGDLLVTIDGQSVTSHQGLLEYAKAWQPGQTLRLNLQRGDEELALDVTLMTAEELAELIQHDPVANQRQDE